MKKKLGKIISVLLTGLMITVLSGIFGTAFAADDVITYDPGTVVVPFTKSWDDYDDEDGKRPDEITINLYRYKGDTYSDSDLFRTAKVTRDNDWKYDFVLQDTTDPAESLFYIEDGEYHVYNFAVEEEEIPLYTETEHKDPSIKMGAVEDYWDRHTPNNELTMEIETGTYPKHFIAIKATGQAEYKYYIWTPEVLSLVEQHILEAFCEKQAGYGGEDWGNTAFLTGFGYHSEIGFNVTENRITFDRHSNWAMWAAGKYDRSTELENSAAITNKHNPTVDINVSKVWDDEENQDGCQPDHVTAFLMIGDHIIDPPGPLVLDESNNWSGTWTGQDKYDEQGRTNEYTVGEVTTDVITGTDGPGTYAYIVTKKPDGTFSFVITNKHTPEKTEVQVSKVWDDNDNQDGCQPESVTAVLLADGQEVGDPLVLDEGNQWSGGWTELDKYKAGVEIEYTVDEVKTDVITGTDGPGTYAIDIVKEGEDNTFVITNTHTPEKTDVQVSKVWDDKDNQDGCQPESVTAVLLADGQEVGDPVVLDAGSQWSGSWTGLDKYKAGVEIEYTVDEVKTDVITGTDGPGTYAIDIAKEGEDNTFVITNTHTPEKTEVKVTKTWDDQDDKDKIRPQKINARILANGKEVKAGEITKSDNWTTVFKDLPVYEKGSKVQYTVKEDSVEGYTTTITGSVEDGFTIKNSHTPKDPPKPGPSTGDHSGLSMWVLVGAVNLFILCGCIIYFIVRKVRER